MAEHFSKTYTSPEDLVKLLMSRGLQVSNEAKAAAYIRNIGYFRLSAYFYPFLKKPKNLHQYKKRSSFNKVLKLYRFDRKLRLIMFNEIETQVFNTDKSVVSAKDHSPTIEPPELPEPLATPEAMVLWQKAQQAGYVNEHFQPLLSRTLAALLADAMAERLGIKEKWKVFEGLWHRKYMRSDYSLALTRRQSLDFQDELKRLFG